MRTPIETAVAAMILALTAAAALAQDDEREAILAVMERAFHAVGSGNPDDMRAIQLADGTSLSFRAHPNGMPGELLMRMSSNEELLAGADDSGGRFEERWTASPTVLIRGPIAVVWGEYEFRIDGAFSHCGIDAVDLVRIDGAWKIANWMWTVEKDNCPTDPSRTH